MPIKVLEPQLAAQIAAGEVVERPASVVKELVENSLDAQASQIIVEIQGGGVERIRVTDNGQGIPPAEVELAFQHHATSKLQTQDQLDTIATLGFRGEAIPSIAAVSQMTMTTRLRPEGAGRHIDLQWGRIVRAGAQGCPPGTSITVSDLFGNLPARRKFLKSPSAESTRIHELISRYALAYPDIRFQLLAGGRQVLATPGSGRREEGLLAVYGREVADRMLEVSVSDPDTGYGMDGFVSAPDLHRANRTYMSLFVNRRWIQNRMLAFALEEAYHGLLPDKRYPLAVLNLTLPYAEVDVNCHPAKREVRFHHEGTVYSTLQRAVRAALVADSPVPLMGGRGGLAAPASDGGATAGSPGFFWSAFDRPDAGKPLPASGVSTRQGAPAGVPQGFPAPADAAATVKQALPSLRVVGQVKLTYVVAEGPDGMYLVDQHAAHERVLFDGIRRLASLRAAQSQPLLEPVTVELSPGQAEVFRENAEFLSCYGFQVEPFGEGSYLLRAVPTIFTAQDPSKSLMDVLDLVAFEGLLRQHEDVLAASIACHGAIRAGRSLTEPEMRALLEQLEATENPHTCPHGRPTLIHLSAYQMEREFGRR